MRNFPSAENPDMMAMAAESLRKHFSPLDDVSALPMPANKEIYQELVFFEYIHEWVLYSYLICPQAIETVDEFQNILLDALNQRYLLSVFRGVSMDVHDEYLVLFSWWPVSLYFYYSVD